MTTLPDLEPAAREACPFCDGEPQLIDGGPGNFYVRCVQCNATGDDGSRDYALSRWNRRAARSAPEAGKAVVRPLDLSNLLRHAFMFGFETMGGTAEAAKAWWPEYNPEECPAFERILSALASVPAPSGAEPVAWMVLRKDNLHLPVLTSREDADKYQRFNPEETLQPLYASPQPVAPTGEIAGLVERLNGCAEAMDAAAKMAGVEQRHYRSDTIREAAAALANLSAELEMWRSVKHSSYWKDRATASEAEAADLRAIISECAKALGNGAYIAPTCTVEFMRNLPEEIRLVVVDLRRKLEEHQDAEDKAAREMATVIQGLRNRATAAERKLEEARKALEPFATVGEIFEESAGWSDTDEIELSPEDGPRMAVIKLSHFRRASQALESDNAG